VSIAFDEHLKIAFTISNNLKKFIHRGKDCLDYFSKQDVVYKIECSDCKVSYVDHTKRRLQTRTNEHQSDINKETRFPSVISDYRTSFNHEFKWEKVEILDNEPIYYYKKRIISEMIHIKKQKYGLNRQTDRSIA